MPVYRRALPHEVGQPHVQPRYDIRGHEAGRIHHAGSCPLRGQVQMSGAKGPFCSAECSSPTEPILVATIYRGLVLACDETTRTATVWDILAKRPIDVPLPDDEAFPAFAEVDAGPSLQRHYGTWLTWRALEKERIEQAQKEAAAAKEARRKAHEEREERARAQRLVAAALQAAEKQRKIASVLRRGSPVEVVSDPPGFAERNRRLKPRNRAPSQVGMVGFLDHVGSYSDPHVFLRLPDGSSIRVLRSQVRVVLPDGSLGVEDIPPESTPRDVSK